MNTRELREYQRVVTQPHEGGNRAQRRREEKRQAQRRRERRIETERIARLQAGRLVTTDPTLPPRPSEESHG